MSWRDEAERALPPPRRHEPADLRADILDELADHLALAAERERGRNGNAGEDAIWARVLEQFGNPQTLAQRLWWDAMKETVMREWIQTTVVVLACVAVVLFLGIMFRQMQTMNQTLISVIQQQKGADSSGTATLAVTARRGTASGPPVAKMPVTLSGSIFRNDADTVTKDTDAQGRVSFGPMQFGNFYLCLEDTETGMTHRRQVTLFAGDSLIEAIAPEVAFTEVKVDVGTPPLADDALQRILLTCQARWGDKDNEWFWDRPMLAGRDHTSLLPEEGQRDGRPRPRRPISFQGNSTFFGLDTAMQSRYPAEESEARIPGTSITFKTAILVLYAKHGQLNDPNIAEDSWVAPQDRSFECEGMAKYTLKEQVLPLQPGASATLQVPLPELLNKACAHVARLAASASLIPILPRDVLSYVLTAYPDWVPVNAKPAKAMANILAGNTAGTWRFEGPFVNQCELWDHDRKMIAMNAPFTQEELAILPSDSKVVLMLNNIYGGQEESRTIVPEDALEAYALAGPWMPAGWPDSFPKDGSELPCTLPARAENPFAQLSAQEVRDQTLPFLDVTAWLRGGDGAQPENGLLLRWKSESQNARPALAIGNCHRTAESRGLAPIWIVLKPVASEGKAGN